MFGLINKDLKETETMFSAQVFALALAAGVTPREFVETLVQLQIEREHEHKNNDNNATDGSRLPQE